MDEDEAENEEWEGEHEKYMREEEARQSAGHASHSSSSLC
jgi:hypothetical protein